MYAYKETLQQKFNDVYNNLNPEQKMAVDTIEGPVMVIAGPGTGKTQILAARIGKILLETDALPENILCLTYTEAGAIAMRRRLLTFIGADAYKVNIYTYHAFCNDVIQDNLPLFEKNTLDPVSALESIRFFKELIDRFPKGHLLKRYRGDVYYDIKNLQSLFSAMKKENWSPEYIIPRIDQYIRELPTREEYIYQKKYREFNKGDKKQDKIDQEIEKMERLKAAVSEFENYRQIMLKYNRYDFDDMINWVIKVFENNDTVLADYQEKFQYILVDEYQDTSGSQNKLVQLLINYWHAPNIFVVGDDDQSIFRFQGANIENMQQFANEYKNDLKKIILTRNYRSTQPILDTAKILIDKNEERLITKMPGINKNLQASNHKIKELTNFPEILEYETVKEEMAGICNRVEALIQSGTDPAHIAIIYKENNYGKELAGFFQLKKIPYYIKSEINLLHHPFISKLILWLNYLNAEQDVPYGGDEMLFKILHFDFYEIPAIDIAKLVVDVNKKKYNGELVSIRSLLYDNAHTAPKNLFDTGPKDWMKKMSAIIEQLISDVPNVTIQRLFSHIIQNAGILSYIMKNENKISLMQMLSAFFNFIKEENTRNPELSLGGLVEIINIMKSEDLPVSIQNVSGSDKGVNLLTNHGSKGLEFKHVFIIGANANFWEKKRARSQVFQMPDTLFASLAVNPLEELRRLFYVGITRAETHLYISYPRYKNDGKELEPTLFIMEIQEQLPELIIQKQMLSAEEMFAYDSLQLSAHAPEIEKIEADFINALLEKFVMNVTALNNYLKCPLQFYYNNLIRIPSGKNEATEFGSAIHDALEKLFNAMQADPQKNFEPVEKLVDYFKRAMRKRRENFTPQEFARRIEYGEEVIKNYYTKYVHTWNKIVVVERNIKGVTINNVPIKGKLDKLEFDGTHINVVDYKTGKVENALKKLKSPDEKEPLGGDYWRQAVFYKILVDNYPSKNWKVVSSEFDFIEPDTKQIFNKIKLVIEPQDVETVKNQITTAWQKIQNKEFYTGCGKDDCTWCNFVKDNKLDITKLEQEAEEDAALNESI